MTFRRCILLLADGARPDVFQKLISEGRLPAIEEFLLKEGALTPAVSTFPSTTGPAYLPFLTGCHAGTCNLPGIRWFDRKKYAQGGLPLRSFRSYVGPESLLMNGDVSPNISTLFDIFPGSVNIFSPINRGVSFRHNKTKFSRIWYCYYSHLTDHWSLIDKASAKKLMTVIEGDEDPEFIFAVFPGIDEHSHLGDPFHPVTLASYELIDRTVASLVAALKKKGCWEETLLGIVSDHGLSSTQKHLSLNQFLDQEGLRPFHYPFIFNRKFQVANMVSGNGMSHLYFKNKQGWEKALLEEEIRADYPGILEKLLARPEIDLISCRGQGGEIIALSRRGRARIGERQGKIFYQVEGADPFGYPALPEMMSPREILEKTFDTDYPDAPMQLMQIFRSERTGDVILSAAKGYDLRKRYEVPEHKSSHGSLHREHMMTPFILNAPLQKKMARTVDVFPTLLKLMGREIPQEIDGESLV
ncbi:MAG: alkaline phosphatase family protein [Deltaproteobacteria bacterium]|nr:alkaline phosphatase family protein [Deltaproteobacteria bacterium]